MRLHHYGAGILLADSDYHIHESKQLSYENVMEWEKNRWDSNLTMYVTYMGHYVSVFQPTSSTEGDEVWHTVLRGLERKKKQLS